MLANAWWCLMTLDDTWRHLMTLSKSHQWESARIIKRYSYLENLLVLSIFELPIWHRTSNIDGFRSFEILVVHYAFLIKAMEFWDKNEVDTPGQATISMDKHCSVIVTSCNTLKSHAHLDLDHFNIDFVATSRQQPIRNKQPEYWPMRWN